ncbi:MAG: aldo/keto reductase [Phycisphaeraceae bacterium]
MTTVRPTPAETKQHIPGIDLPVSRIALGCMSIVASETYGGVGPEQAIDTVRTAIDEGITLLDTAPAYGNGESEELVGRAIEGKRDKVVLATKASGPTLSGKEIAEDCETSLKRLKTDYIDLYQVHWNRRVVPAEETVRALEKLLDEGKVRAIGVCNYGPKDLQEIFSLTDKIRTNQMAYSMLVRAIEFEIVDLCIKHNVGILCYSPLAQGLLTGRYRSADEVPVGRQRTRHFSCDRELARHGQPGCEKETFEAIAQVRAICEEIGQPMGRVALAWCLHQPGVTSVLAGASRPDQVRENVRAAELTLSEDVLEKLDRATATVKEILGADPDVWAAESRIR